MLTETTFKDFTEYNPPAVCHGMRIMRDVYITMRDGARICADIHLPDAPGPFPALLSYGQHNKDLLNVECCDRIPAQPAWSRFWFGNQETGDTRYITSRGYAHVIAQARGSGKSDPGVAVEAMFDHYDVIEWMAGQEWCDGNIGMCGLSNFSLHMLMAAISKPPHLKAIYAQDPGFFYGFFREMHLGGVLNPLFHILDVNSVDHIVRTTTPELEGREQELWEKAIHNPDYMMYRNIYNILTQKGQIDPFSLFYHGLVYPYDEPASYEQLVALRRAIDIPVYIGSGQYAIDYHFHWQGAQNWWENLTKGPKKLSLAGPLHRTRPLQEEDYHHEMMKWYDYWLKGIDTGIMDEPPVRYWVTGENKWHYGSDWPLPETVWTPVYLDSWERLRFEPFDPDSWQSSREPDAFVQMPPTLTNEVAKLRYLSEPLTEDLTIAGPVSAVLYASLDSEDTNWFVTLKDVGPGSHDHTGRSGETELNGLSERYLTKGMLKASMRALDKEKSKPWKPWHKLTEDAQQMVIPGEINEYRIEVLSVCHTFKAGHRICVEISCQDLPDGPNCTCNTEYIPYHICRNATVLHKIYRDAEHPSGILLPVIPSGS